MNYNSIETKHKDEVMDSVISIEIHDLCKSYKKHLIFDNAELCIKGGDCVALVGENGCGKSTLMNILAGLLKKDSGDVRILLDNEDIPQSDWWKYVSYVPQTNCLIESLTAYDNLLFWYQGNSKKLKNDIENGFIKELGIDSYINRKISKLSGGMKKRVSVACALANNPRVLLLDEVNASLDIICKLQITKMLASYAAAGNIVITSTHEEGDLHDCNKIYYIDNHKMTEVPLTSLKEIFKDKL